MIRVVAGGLCGCFFPQFGMTQKALFNFICPALPFEFCSSPLSISDMELVWMSAESMIVLPISTALRLG